MGDCGAPLGITPTSLSDAGGRENASRFAVVVGDWRRLDGSEQGEGGEGEHGKGYGAERAIASRAARNAGGVADARALPTRGRVSPDATRFPHQLTG